MTDESKFLEPVDTCQITGLQQILYGVFGGKRDGYFVEVGAYDGITYSNTYQLAVAGWGGLYVEPVPSLYDRCVGNHKNHPDIVVVQAAVGNLNEEILPMFTDGNELYTTRKWLANDLVGSQNVIHYSNVNTRSLDSILREFNVPRHFDLLVVDVEGAEVDVLQGLHIMSYFPRMIIIEAHELHPNVKLRRNASSIDEIMRMSLYEKIYCDRWNNIYVR